MAKEEISHPDIETKIKHVLEEARVILPGTQVLLGFQFTSVFQQEFNKMELSLKYLHLAGLCTLTIAIIMLFGIVSYHRIADGGMDTDKFNSFAHNILILSLLFVGAGLCIDIYIVTMIVAKNSLISDILTLIFSLFILFLWFGYTLFQRKAARVNSER
jgi:hypothetical protein